MGTHHRTIADRQWERQSDSEIARTIAGQSPKEADDTIRDLNHAYRAAAGLNLRLTR